MAIAPPQQQGVFHSGMPVAHWDCRPAGPSSSTSRSELSCYPAGQQQARSSWQRLQRVQQQHGPDWSGPCRCGGCMQQWEQQQRHLPQKQQLQQRWHLLPPPQQQEGQWYQPPQKPFLSQVLPSPSLPPPPPQQQQWHQPPLQPTQQQQQQWLQSASSVHAVCAPTRNDSGISSDGDNYTYGAAAAPLVSPMPPFAASGMDTENEQLPQTDAAVVMGLDAEILRSLPEWGSCGSGSGRAYSA